MRENKKTKPTRSVRYLLSADRRLQKLSLRKMSERAKIARRPARSVHAKTAARAKDTSHQPWAMSWPVIVAVICVGGAAALIAGRQPADGRDVAAMETSPGYSPQTAPVARLDTAKPVAPKAPSPPAVLRTRAADVSMPKPRPTGSARPAVVAESAVVPVAAPVTITGCLELAGETFLLKDASGVDAPKSRSWRFGFLKKRPSKIELVDATRTLKLTNHVGERLAVTGVLANREMQARSVRRIAASCN